MSKWIARVVRTKVEFIHVFVNAETAEDAQKQIEGGAKCRESYIIPPLYDKTVADVQPDTGLSQDIRNEKPCREEQ